jgi:hypothetical protein
LVAAEIRAAVEAERERCVRVAQRAAGAWFYDIPDDYEEILDGAMREDS